MCKTSLHFYDLFLATSKYSQLIVTEQYISWMCKNAGPTVNYTRQNYGTATVKLAYECDKSLVVRQQIFISKIHVWQVESYL